MRLLVVAVLQLGLSGGVQFSMHSANLIQEHGVEYHQHLSYDPQEEVLKIEVPAHLDIEPSVSIFYKKQNLQVVYIPWHHSCQVDEIPNDLDIKEMMKLSLNAQLNGNIFGPKIAEDLYEVDISLPMSGMEKASLPQYVQKICAGSTISRVHSIKVTEDDFYNSTLNTYPHQLISVDSRRKRNVPDFLPVCRETADKCTTKGWGYRCRWLLVPTENAPADILQVYHSRKSSLSCIMCCMTDGKDKYSPIDGFCKCDKVTSEKTFKDCYPHNGAYYGK